jgi:putative hydrolase of the HAD superfamily
MKMDPAATWMVGNSPKSDINPALAAGLAAVLVPNENTWSLEREELPPPSERFRVVERFTDLCGLF